MSLIPRKKNTGTDPTAPIRIVTVYLIVGVLWILFSDRVVLHFFPESVRLSWVQTVKGLGFVAALGGVLYILLERHIRRVMRFENALVTSETHLRTLMEQASDAILINDVRGNYTEVNDAACRMLGYTRQEFLGLNVVDLVPDEELGEYSQELDRFLAGQPSMREVRLQRKDRTSIYVELNAKMLSDGRFLAIGRDVTERLVAQQTLARQRHDLNERVKELNCLYSLTTLLHHSEDPEPWERVVALLPSALQYPEVAFARIRFDGHVYETPGFLEARWRLLAEVRVAGALRGTVEVRYGQERPAADDGPFTAQERELLDAVAAHIGDYIERRETAATLESTYRTLEAVFEACPLAIIALDPETRVTLWNPAATRIFGYAREEVAGKPHVLVPEDKRDEFRKRFAEELQGRSFHYQTLRLTKDRRLVDVSFSSAPLRDATGRIIGSVGVLEDITQQKRNEERLRLVNTALQAATHAVAIADVEGVITWVNPAFTDLTGYAFAEAVGGSMNLLEGDAEDETFFRALRAAVRAGGVWQGESVGRRKDGSSYMEEQTVTPVLGEDGAPIAFIAIRQDVTRRKEAERVLAESEERFRVLVQNSSDIITVLDPEGRIVYLSPSVERILGLPMKELVGQYAHRFVHPDDRRAVGDAFARLRVPGDPVVVRIGFRYRHASGRWVQFESVGSNESSESLGGFVMNSRDVTDRKQLEEELRQSQKMEAVGRLAGGIAHDFNNLLMAIGGYSELLLESLTEGDPRRDDLFEIVGATDRAAALVRQLLAFSRQRESQREAVDLNRLIREMLKLIGRTIGRDVHLSTALDPSLPSLTTIPSHLEQVLLNLSVNARDAMPGGGVLGIETLRVEVGESTPELRAVLSPGRYARLTVMDSGTGMSEEVKTRIFEPFFTTKSEGKGTGLGLATVYAIVEEMGGHIRVQSEPGAGTRFDLYLPAHEERATEGGAPPSGSDAPTPQHLMGKEIVLLLEDDERMRRTACDALESYGYRVLAATDAQDALKLFRQHRDEIALLLSDAVMPGTTGAMVYGQMKAEAPSLKVLFMTGYAHGLGDDTDTGVGVPLLQKPFSLARLARTVRNVLDG